jgi:hypothetical protein
MHMVVYPQNPPHIRIELNQIGSLAIMPVSNANPMMVSLMPRLELADSAIVNRNKRVPPFPGSTPKYQGYFVRVYVGALIDLDYSQAFQFKESEMAKGRIKRVVETVEGWVGMGPKAVKKKTAKGAKKASRKKKGNAKTMTGKKASKKAVKKTKN